MENSVVAEYLTIHYRLPTGSSPVGVALYVPSTDSLYIMFREDLSWIDDPYDLEFLAETSNTFSAIADQKGPKATFEWMSDTLSNALYVEGPLTLRTSDPEKTVKELCEPDSPSATA